MENYKEKYEHALDNFKKIKAANKDNNELVDFIEYEYPELKESEDEKIRKGLINTFSVYYKDEPDGEWDGKPVKDIIAWLEKQGEQKPTEDNCKISDCVETVDMTEYNNGYECGKQRVLKYPEEYGLCKKPTWSEEDEEKRIDAIKYLEIFDAQGIHGDVALPCINWLKSLKERYSWRPSDEQIKALNYVVNQMASSESPTENDYYYNVFKDMRTQLKKLKE